MSGSAAMHIRDVKTPMLAEFYRAWKGCADTHGVAMPTRKMLGLSALGALAQHTMLYALYTDKRLKVLRTGIIVDDWWGGNMSGLEVADILAPAAYSETVLFHTKIIKDGCAGFAHEWLSHSSGANLECKSLVLPLAGHNGDVRGYTISVSSLKSRDYRGLLDGVYQDLVSRKLVDLHFIDLG